MVRYGIDVGAVDCENATCDLIRCADRYLPVHIDGSCFESLNVKPAPIVRAADEHAASKDWRTYRHQLVASPEYLQKNKLPKKPQDLLQHRLLAFSFWRPENTWKFIHANRRNKESITFKPYLAINEYDGLATALLAGTGIGDLPPIVQPELLRSGQLVEVMPKWHFAMFHLSLCHLGNRFVPRPVRVFIDYAAKMAPVLFPNLPA